MADGFFLLHLIPFDGKYFDDPEQAIFSLVVLNLIVFVLLMLALMSVREGRKKAALEAKARRRANKPGQADQLVPVTDNLSTELSGHLTAATSKPHRPSQPLAAVSHSKNYTRPSKK